MPRPKGSKNKVTVTVPVDERIAAVEQEIEELNAALKAKKKELRALVKAKEEEARIAAEKKAKEDREKIDAAIAASGKTVEEILELLRGRCFINLDKFWTCPDRIAHLVRTMNMQDQVLIKTSATAENFARVEEVAPDLPFMAIAWDRDDFTDELLRRNMRYVGVEALFASEDKPIAQPEYLQSMKDKGLLAWANSIVYDHRAVLTAGHTDDIAVSTDPDFGWGWLVKRGFNIIQTDWPLALAQYLGR